MLGAAAPLFALLVALALFIPAASAQDGVPAAEHRAITGVIAAQIDAFRRDDGAEAFSYASPGIRAQFQTPEMFMTMVRAGYPAVYRPQAFEFLEPVVRAGEIAQPVSVIGPDGEGQIALYRMERQPDGSWKIKGVVMLRTGEVGS